MKWFNNPTSVEELKKQYKMLIRVCHPDNGGNMDTMKEINAEYDQLYKELEAREQGQGTYNGSSYQTGGYTSDGYNNGPQGGGYSNGQQGGYNNRQPYDRGPYNNSGYNGNYGNYNGSPYYNNRRNSGECDDCCNCCTAMLCMDMCCN